MLRSLYGKLALIWLLLFCAVGILYTLLTVFTTGMYQQEVNQKLNRGLARNIVADQLLSSQGEVSPYALKELFHLLMVVNPSIEMYLLDAHGVIINFSAPPDKIKRSTVSLAPIHSFLAQADAFPILGDDPRDISRTKVFSASAIPLSGQPTGYLYIVLGGEEYDSVVDMLRRSYILRLSLWTALTGLLFALLAGLFLFNMLTRRLSKLALSMETFARNDFSDGVLVHQNDLIPNQQSDEIDRLRTTFHQMMQRILQQVATLKQTDVLRRELVANVSHDLRTPLASLHGYLETLLMKEGTLTREEHKNFLDIALKQSERLRELVGELFELARLDSRESCIQREECSIAELVQDVCQKFQLTVANKGITLNSSFPNDLPFVVADIGLIERALENILQNAARYTPAGGTITVSLSPKPSSVRVCVSDTGCGIEADDLPYIFDRFYKANRQDRSGGAGLGLAITKRIIELNGSTIRAESTPNVGTVISFELPTAHS